MITRKRRKWLKSLAKEMSDVITAGWCRREDIIEYTYVNRTQLTKEEMVFFDKHIKI